MNCYSEPKWRQCFCIWKPDSVELDAGYLILLGFNSWFFSLQGKKKHAGQTLFSFISLQPQGVCSTLQKPLHRLVRNGNAEHNWLIYLFSFLKSQTRCLMQEEAHCVVLLLGTACLCYHSLLSSDAYRTASSVELTLEKHWPLDHGFPWQCWELRFLQDFTFALFFSLIFY